MKKSANKRQETVIRFALDLIPDDAARLDQAQGGTLGHARYHRFRAERSPR